MKQDNQDKMGNAVLLQSSFPSRLLSLAQLKLKMAETLYRESNGSQRLLSVVFFPFNQEVRHSNVSGRRR